MPRAWVTCKGKDCGILVDFGDEHYRDGRAYCKPCYDAGKDAEMAKTISKMEKASGIKLDKPTPENKSKPKNTPDKCETCSGAEEKCVKCGGMLCRPKDKEECEQYRHGRICLDCYDSSLGKS